MTPEERCYKILQASNYIRVPEEDPAQKVEVFLDSAKECTWEYPSNPVEEKQFETSFKSWFNQFHQEQTDFVLENPPVHMGEKNGSMTKWIGVHTMDDYGYEGMVMEDGTFWRILDDYTCDQCKKHEVCTDPLCKNDHCSKCIEWKYEEYLKEIEK